MIDLTSPDTVEEAYASIEEQYRGTPFEGFAEVYRKHENIVRFFVESSDEFVPDAYLGSHKSLLEDGVDIDDEKLVGEVEESGYITLIDFLRLGQDIADFYHQVISENTDTWTDVTELFASISEDITAEEIDDTFRKQQEETVSEIEEMLDSLEGEDEEAVEEIRQMKEEIRNKNLRDMLLESFEMQSQMSSMGLDMFTYGDVDIKIGDYFVYQVHPHQNHLTNRDEYEIDFSEETVFNIIGKITGVTQVEEDLGDITEYGFDLIAYDSDVKELYPEFWMFNEDARLKPQHSSDLTIHTVNPIGDVPPRVN